MTNPKPASPLPWRDATQIEKGGAGTVFGKRVVDTDGRGPVVEQRHMADWEHADQDRAYILWAANNAPALQARIERLEDALNRQRNKLSLIVQINPETDSDPPDALRQAVELAKAALEAE